VCLGATDASPSSSWDRERAQDRVLRQGVPSRYGSSSGCHDDNEGSSLFLDTSLGMFKLRAEAVGLPARWHGAVRHLILRNDSWRQVLLVCDCSMSLSDS